METKLETLKAKRHLIFQLASQRGAYNVRVFGSVARGNAGESSDIDFLVDLEPGRSLFDLGGLLMDLQDLLQCKVDIGTNPIWTYLLRQNSWLLLPVLHLERFGPEPRSRAEQLCRKPVTHVCAVGYIWLPCQQ